MVAAMSTYPPYAVLLMSQCVYDIDGGISCWTYGCGDLIVGWSVEI